MPAKGYSYRHQPDPARRKWTKEDAERFRDMLRKEKTLTKQQLCTREGISVSKLNQLFQEY